MPMFREYPFADHLNPTDVFLVDQLGIGTRAATVQMILDLVGGGGPYDIAMNYSQPPPPSTTFLTFIANREFTTPESMAGSVAEFVNGPSEPLVLTVAKNGAEFGTISFPAAANGGSIGVFAGSAESFGVGDLLEIVSPAATFGAGNVALTIAGALTP